MTGPTPKRDAILHAALDAFADHGVGVAVPQIADRAGVGTGTIYRYFASKEDLINELFVARKEALADRLFAEYPASATPFERFRMFWSRLDDFARQEPAAFRFLEMQDHGPHLTAASRAVEKDLLGRHIDRVRELQDAGVFRRDIRPHVIATTIWGAFVQLHRAARAGHIALSPDDIDQACLATWTMCTSPAPATA